MDAQNIHLLNYFGCFKPKKNHIWYSAKQSNNLVEK